MEKLKTYIQNKPLCLLSVQKIDFLTPHSNVFRTVSDIVKGPDIQS